MVSEPSQPAASSPKAAEYAWLACNALVPALVAASQLDLYADGSRDAGVIGTVGLGYAGGFRALDTWAAALFAAVPLGTRTLRAELPGVFLLGLVAMLLFTLARRGLVAVSGVSVWSSLVATVATSTLTCAYGFQHEATVSGSGLLGVALVLAALLLPSPARKTLASWAGLFALGLTYEPMIGVSIAVAGLTRFFVARPPSEANDPSSIEVLLGASLAVAAGLVPFALTALHSKVSGFSTSAPLFSLPSPESTGPDGAFFPEGSAHRALSLVESELGRVLMVLAAVGLVWGLVSVRARRENLPLAAVAVVASIALLFGAGGSREAWSPLGLVALSGYVACAAIAMQEAVIRIARARLPLASGSAAMVVLLEAAFPAIVLDEGLSRAAARAPLALARWEDTAFAGLPGGGTLLVSSPRLYARVLASRASADFPMDLGALPTFDPKNEASASALARDTRLVPLFRDIALTGVPQELSLSNLTLARPLVLATDPRWDRSLTRHLVPAGLLSLFEPEPRGGSDRKHALEASAPSRSALAKTLSTPSLAPLAALTASLLLDRALAAVQTGEKEVALQALEETYEFAPKDARIAKLIFKETNARGPVDVHELLPSGLAAGP